MNTEQAIAVLTSHNAWRRDEESAWYQNDPKAIGEAIDLAIEALRDTARLDALERTCEAYGTEVHEGNRWTVDGPYTTVRAALDDLRATVKP